MTRRERPDDVVTLERSYAACKRLNRVHGTTYYWSTLVLPRIKQHHVHALYGFCRYADEIVDAPGQEAVEQREQALTDFGDRFFADLARGQSDDLVLKAVVHTVKAFSIDPGCFRRFLRSMAMDLTIGTYETYEDLEGYMEGSAAVIGEMMLPILEPASLDAVGPARDLGNAFQLTNFWRDIAEDLDRGRVYVPQEDLRKFGADPSERRVTPEWRDLLRFEIDRTRDLYRSAEAGLALLPPRESRCIGAAGVLYGEILDAIEAQDYDVFTQRARVSPWRKGEVVARSLLGL